MRIEKRTVCPYDCPDSCGMIATIEITDQGRKLIQVRGDKEHPETKGFLCQKTRHYEKMVNHPDRILFPMKRVGEKGKGIFEKITWEQAIREICDRWKEIIEEYGAESILPYSYAGTEGVLQRKCGRAFFHYLGASKLKRTICASGKSAGWKAVMGTSMGMPVHRLAESDYIIIWSSNIVATRLHEIPYIREAREHGARVVMIDVYDSPTMAFCDEAHFIRPGTDGALALAMLHILDAENFVDLEYIEEHVQGYERLKESLPFYTPEWAAEVTGLSEECIYDLARKYGRASRPAILLGSGLSRQQNGAMTVRCISALPAGIGSWKQGFGITGLNQSAVWGDSSMITREDFEKRGVRSLNMMQLAGALNPQKTNPPIQSLYVYNSNPVNVTTNQAELVRQLKREDLFTVVHERFMTDTALYADLILPAVFSLESYDIFQAYGYNGIQYSKKIMDPPGECRSNWNTFACLAKAMGFEDSYFMMTEEEKCLEYLDHITGQQKKLNDEEWQRLMEGYAVERTLSGPLEIRTKSGKIELYNPEVKDPLIAYRPLTHLSEHPIHLIAAPSRYTLNSTFTSQEDLTKRRGPMTLLLSKKDAMERNIKDGDRILCQNALASVEFIADIRDHILPGTAVAEGVYPRKMSLNGYTVNALFSEELSDLGEATTMNGNFVEILPL